MLVIRNGSSCTEERNAGEGVGKKTPLVDKEDIVLSLCSV